VFAPEGDRLDQTFFERHQCAFWDGTPFGAVAP
jgi:para-nitrobenzyl esterase